MGYMTDISNSAGAGLEGVSPFKGAEPVIRTLDLGLEPTAVPLDPTGTGRFLIDE